MDVNDADSHASTDAGHRMPEIRELLPAPSSVDAFQRLAGLPYLIFLDSAARDDPVLGRYSYIAASPAAILTTRNGSYCWLERSSENLENPAYIASACENGDPFDLLKARLGDWAGGHVDGLPPFQGGAAGLFGYGLNRSLESIPEADFDEFQCPALAVGMYDWVLAFDHRDDRCWLIARSDTSPASREPVQDAARRVDEVLRRLQTEKTIRVAQRTHPLSLDKLAPHWPVPRHSEVLSNFSREDYIEVVSRGIEYVRAGDIFQVNLSQRLLVPQKEPALNFYLRLRAVNSAPFAGYFDMGDHIVASSSPEQFLSVTNGIVTTRPIKGTRSRGYTPEEDTYRRIDLGRSGKDRAENVMIVDLLRNDLSRVCEKGSVTVPKLFELERHPTVHHLVSEVRGRLRSECSALDLLRAAFPGGSITGAPKVRAMEIVAELEPTARGAYCGSLGWISAQGGMSTSILIRTVTIARGWLQMPVGGGIVADSRPEDEYQETLDKAAGMLRALP